MTPQEQAVYDALVHNGRRVISRRDLARAAGIAELSDRRCDALIAGIRRNLGPQSVRTVRRRGWIIGDQ